jgi:hypothetical protein
LLQLVVCIIEGGVAILLCLLLFLLLKGTAGAAAAGAGAACDSPSRADFYAIVLKLDSMIDCPETGFVFRLPPR